MSWRDQSPLLSVQEDLWFSRSPQQLAAGVPLRRVSSYLQCSQHPDVWLDGFASVSSKTMCCQEQTHPLRSVHTSSKVWQRQQSVEEICNGIVVFMTPICAFLSLGCVWRFLESVLAGATQKILKLFGLPTKPYMVRHQLTSKSSSYLTAQRKHCALKIHGSLWCLRSEREPQRLLSSASIMEPVCQFGF